jgi:cobalt-zinc-cadmium efflux system outer membrane protein
MVQRQNPDVLVARQQPNVARGELRQARTVRYNPELNYVGGSDAQVTLTQDIEWAGQRGLRASAAETRLTRTELQAADVTREVVADASLAYFRVLAAEAKQKVVAQLGTLTERLIGAVRVQLAEGEISVLDANLGEIERGRVQARMVGARRDVIAAEIELKRLLGVAQDVALRLDEDSGAVRAPVSLDEDTLVAVALRRRPDVRDASAAIDEARAMTTLARREARPNVRAGVVADPRASGNSVGLAVGLSLPVINRNRGTIDARAAETQRAERQRAATQNRVKAEVAAALAAYRTATEELRLFAETVLQPARTNAELLGEAYRAGKIPLPSLLLLRNQLLDAEFGYWDAWLARREALVRLDAATGATTSSTTSSERRDP